ncbi:MAG: hypothetical protein ABIH78_02675 [Candidatus Peregrinibacteria bacterium]
MQTLQIVSIVIEGLIAVIALACAFKKQPYMLGFTITFGIYVYYDLAKLYSWPTSPTILPIIFFIATLAALFSIVAIYRRRMPNR